jgi:NAD(P)-dependent dehydrogenase (short-subunit alcohol dehydrogenase family)
MDDLRQGNWIKVLAASVEEWDTVFATNARGTFLCYKYAAKRMIAQGRGGRIIGACSMTGKRGALFRFSEFRMSSCKDSRAGEGMAGPYSSTKFAIRGLTQSAGE